MDSHFFFAAGVAWTSPSYMSLGRWLLVACFSSVKNHNVSGPHLFSSVTTHAKKSLTTHAKKSTTNHYIYMEAFPCPGTSSHRPSPEGRTLYCLQFSSRFWDLGILPHTQRKMSNSLALLMLSPEICCKIRQRDLRTCP